jgi:pimeloyl-ACP methyl ester carboxylesterase
VAEVELSAGPIEYTDTGGDGPVLVFLHGVTIDSTVWRKVVAALPPGYRVLLPTLPLGAHRKPMHADADLSLPAMANLVGEFLEALDLRDVTLILNDWGGAQLLISAGNDERIGRLVLTSCEAFDNYPPGFPGRMPALAARTPGMLLLTLHALRTRFARRAPGAWGWMSKYPVPKEIMDGWFTPARTNKAVRRDLIKYGTSTPPKRALLDYAEKMRGFDRPVLVAWAAEDKLMPQEHADRLAELFGDARLVRIRDSYTLIPEDQPDALAEAIHAFVTKGTTQAST